MKALWLRQQHCEVNVFHRAEKDGGEIMTWWCTAPFGPPLADYQKGGSSDGRHL